MSSHGGGGHADSSNPFDKRVAMYMAIVASLLAAVTMIGHRTHNGVLRKQGDSNRQRTEAAAYKVESSNMFARFQAKRMRVEMAKNEVISIGLIPSVPELEEKRNAATATWNKYITESNGDPKKPVELEPGKEPDTLPEILYVARQAAEKADEMMKKAEVSIANADHAHHQADWLDLSHLAIELGLVLCSLALLKKRGFLSAGIVAAAIGVGLAGYGLVLPDHSHDAHPTASADNHH